MTATGDERPTDREELSRFLTELHTVLRSTVDEHGNWFPSLLRQPIRDAWEEVQPNFEIASRYLREPPNAALLDARLASVGLAGAQLHLKLVGFRGALQRFRDRSKRGLLQLLGWANILLGTLAGVIPGVEPILEYKEAFERAVAEGDDQEETDSGRGEPEKPIPPIAPIGPRSRPGGLAE